MPIFWIVFVMAAAIMAVLYWSKSSNGVMRSVLRRFSDLSGGSRLGEKNGSAVCKHPRIPASQGRNPQPVIFTIKSAPPGGKFFEALRKGVAGRTLQYNHQGHGYARADGSRVIVYVSIIRTNTRRFYLVRFQLWRTENTGIRMIGEGQLPGQYYLTASQGYQELAEALLKEVGEKMSGLESAHCQQ